jgi:hypothetical protein
LLRNADRRFARAGCRRQLLPLFSPAMNQRASDRVVLTSVLGTALTSERLRLVYRHWFRLTGAIHGVEALALA